MRIRSLSTIPLLLILGLAVGMWTWADVPPESNAYLAVTVTENGKLKPGVVVYWSANPMYSAYHPHGGTPPKMTLSNPQVDYSYTDANGIARMTMITPEYSGIYPWTATCPSCSNFSYSDTVHVDYGSNFFPTQLPAAGSGFVCQYDSGHPYYNFGASTFMHGKAITLGQTYGAATLSHDGIAKQLQYTGIGLPQRGTWDGYWGTHFALRSNPDPHFDLREVIDMVYPGGNDSIYLERVLDGMTTKSGHVGWSYYGVGNNDLGQNLLHADGT